MKTFSALLAICAGNSPVPGEFPAQRPVTRSFDVFFDLRLNKRLRKQSWGWWFEKQPCPLWRQCNDNVCSIHVRTYCLVKVRYVRKGKQPYGNFAHKSCTGWDTADEYMMWLQYFSVQARLCVYYYVVRHSVSLVLFPSVADNETMRVYC